MGRRLMMRCNGPLRQRVAPVQVPGNRNAPGPTAPGAFDGCLLRAQAGGLPVRARVLSHLVAAASASFLPPWL